MTTKRLFGVDECGAAVELFTIANARGEHVELLSRGAAIHSVHVFDGFGNIDDVVLGGPTLETANIRNGEGVTIGRVANVIAGAQYTHNGKTVLLENDGRFGCMHSGSGNWATKTFTGEILSDNSVRFFYVDQGETGFPCNCDVYITFTFDDESALTISYDVVPDGDTPISPTNHAYFNLSGGDIRDLYLQIYAEEYAKMTQNGPGDERGSVIGTPADFRESTKISDAIAKDDGGFFRFPGRPHYNVYYDRKTRGFDKVAELYCAENGRKLSVYSDMPTMVFYNAFYEESMVTKKGEPLAEYCAVCLETQYMANAVNLKTYDSPFFSNGQHFVSKTVYKFETEWRKNEQNVL